MVSRRFTLGKLDTRDFRYLPDSFMGHAADLLGDLCRIRISLERADDLCALLRRKPFSMFCSGKRDARSFGDFADCRVAHAANFPSNLCCVWVVRELTDDLCV